MTSSLTILSVQASGRLENSVSRALAKRTIEHLNPARTLTHELTDGVPFVDHGWIDANFTPVDKRTGEQSARLAFSDGLVDDLIDADVIVIGTPIYNFSVPAVLKAWIDMVARVGRTFKYTETGPVGLLSGKKAIVLVASGGTEVGSHIDFATGYLRHALGFLGISDVSFIAADALSTDMAAKVDAAHALIEAL